MLQLGAGLELLITGSMVWNGPIAGAFGILFAVTAFFFGVYGYRGITRGLVWQVLGTLAGALLVTGIRALMGAENQNLFGLYISVTSVPALPLQHRGTKRTNLPNRLDTLLRIRVSVSIHFLRTQ